MNPPESQGTRTVLITPPAGGRRTLALGQSVVFGRGSQTDISLEDDPWLSRQAGKIAVVESGALVSNLSEKHALYVLFGSEQVRLPVAVESGGGLGFVVAEGEARIGTAAMLERDRAILLSLVRGLRAAPAPGHDAAQPTTGTPVRLDPLTKEFMVAFLLCRPWLLDSTRMSQLPDAPAIGRQALELTGAHHLLRGFDGGVDSPVRKKIAQRVNDHLKEVRKKLRGAGLLPLSPRISLSTIASTLLHYDVIGRHHLALTGDRDWLTAQENKWWDLDGRES